MPLNEFIKERLVGELEKLTPDERQYMAKALRHPEEFGIDHINSCTLYSVDDEYGEGAVVRACAIGAMAVAIDGHPDDVDEMNGKWLTYGDNEGRLVPYPFDEALGSPGGKQNILSVLEEMV